MDKEKYKMIKKVACGVLFTAAAALGALYAYTVVKENPAGIYRRVQSDASGMAKDNCAWFQERMKGDYDAAKALAKDPVGAIKRDVNALEDVAAGRDIKDN